MSRFVYKDKRKRYKGSKTSSGGALFNNIVTKIVLLVVSVLLLYNVGHSISITIQKLDILERARVEVDNLRLRNLELALLLENIQGVEYLEIQARDRLRFSGQEEYIFVVPEAVLEGTADDLNAILTDGRKEDSRGVYEVWRDFFLNGNVDI